MDQFIYWAPTEWMKQHLWKEIYFYYKLFCPASFTQSMETKELLIFNFSDGFEEMMLRLKD